MVSFIAILEGISEFCLPKEKNCVGPLRSADPAGWHPARNHITSVRRPRDVESCLFAGRNAQHPEQSLIPLTGVLRTVDRQQALETTLCLTTSG